MAAPAKLGGYGVVLALALGGGAAVGAAAGPIDTTDGGDAEHETHDETSGATTGESVPPTADATPGGVLMSENDYTIDTDDRQVDGTAGAPFRFRVTGPERTVIREFEPRHERELHFILVATDLGSFAHLHPTRAADGTWTVELPALAPGTYRAVVDVVPAGGPELALGVELAVPGEFAPRPLPASAPTDTVDGYQVALAGTGVAGSSNELALTVTRDGQPVEDLEPYLGAFGHLVAVRSGDLAYLHVHPLEETGDQGGPTVRFAVTVPSPGDYRLFFDFSHDGDVRTAAFTLNVPSDGRPAATPDTTEGHDPHGDHGAAGTEGHR